MLEETSKRDLHEERAQAVHLLKMHEQLVSTGLGVYAAPIPERTAKILDAFRTEMPDDVSELYDRWRKPRTQRGD